MHKLKETIMHVVFLIAALVSIAAVALICVFLFVNGIPAIKEIGFGDFTLGEVWKPTNGYYGILPFILGSIYVTAGALIIGVPIGLLTAIYLAKFCPDRLYKVIKPFINLMAGIPSVVYGFFGMCVLVPMDEKHIWSKWKYDAHGISTSWNDDTSNYHQCIRDLNKSGT